MEKRFRGRIVLGLIVLAVAPSARAAGFKDKDEGSMGPMHDKHPTEVVFANVVIDKKSNDEKALVSSTTLDKPLFVRAYMDRTPARFFHEIGQECSHQRYLEFLARLDGADTIVSLYKMPLEETFQLLRSKTILDMPGNETVSIVATRPFVWKEGDNQAVSNFVPLIAQMKPGANVVTVELMVGCEASNAPDGKNYHAMSTGKITFHVKPGDVATFAKLLKFPRGGDAGAAARIKPQYQKKLVPGAKLLWLSADGTEVESQVKKTTALHTALKNADGTCTYQDGDWVEPYLGGGRYDAGHWDAGLMATSSRIPCP